MKRIFSLILALSLGFSFGACGQGGRPAPASSSSAQSLEPAEPQNTSSSTPQPLEENAVGALAEEGLRLSLTLNGQSFFASLEDGEAAQALLDQLPLTLTMNELNGNEKYHYLPTALPTDPQRPGRIQAGDLMLFGDDCLVLFYESFSSGYSYTRLGHVENAAELAQTLGSGSVTVTFSKEDGQG